MTVLDPFDMLVRLGKITQENVQAADLVEAGVGTSTRAARLVAVGVDKDKLLAALSDLTRMPIAPRELLENAAPMKLPASYRTTMKELLAVPIGRVDEHILDIAIADPRTTTKLRDAAIAHRPRLALEPDILAALRRVFPEEEVLDPIHEPTLKNVPIAPRPISVDEGAVAADAMRDAVAPLGVPDAEGNANAAFTALAPDAPTQDDASAPLGIDGPVATGGDVSAQRKSKPLSPFKLTKEHDEETQRVRRRARAAQNEADEAGEAREHSELSERSGASDAHTPLQRARAAFDDVHTRFANMNARTRAAVAVIAAVTAIVVIGIIASSGPDDDDDGIAGTTLDAGVNVAGVDAGMPMPESSDAGVASGVPIIEPKSEQPQKRKKKKKGSRTQKKKPAAR